MDGTVGEIACLCIVGEGEMGYADHLTHQFHLPSGHAVVQPSAIAEDGIYKYGRSQRALLLAVTCHQPRLLVAEHQASTDSVEREAEFFPYGECATDVVRRILDIELTVVECVRHQCRRQAVGGNAQIGQDG